MKEDYTARLENWSVGDFWVDESIVFGEIFDDKHKRWPNGTQISTSATNQLDFKEGDIVTTRNNRYLLGLKQQPE